MNPLYRMLRRFRLLFRRREAESEMAEEIRFHLEQRAADYTADGMRESEAQAAAQRKFGNRGRIEEEVRDTFGWGWLERGLKDVYLAFRQLLGSPGFTLLAIVTLGLGIGANTAMFNLVNGVMLRPLPYPDQEKIDRIDRATAQNPVGRLSPADFRDLQRVAADYGEISCYQFGDTSLAEPGQPAEMVQALRTAPDLFRTLRVRPQLGREFLPRETIPGNDRVVIISHATWQNRYGGRSDIIGHQIRIDGEPHEIVGVMPAAFSDWRHLGGFEIFRPLALTPEQWADRRTLMLRGIGRRSDRLTRAQGEAFIAHIGAGLAAEHPEVNAGSTWRAVELSTLITGNNGRTMLVMLVGLSGFVLLIACSNLANLFLARTIARAREFAVRAALGASRAQLLRPLISESILLSLAGAGCAMLVAQWVSAWLAVHSTSDEGDSVVLAVDWHVFAWALGVALFTAVAFGLAPALFALRLNLNQTLKSGGRGMTGGRGQLRFRQILIVGQFALAMVLLAGAALFVHGLTELNGRRSGWDSDHLITGTMVLPSARYPDAERISAFQRLVLQRLRTLPGVTSAAVSSFTPFFDWGDIRKFVVDGREPPKPGQEPAAVVNSVSPEYFDTMRTRLLAGRRFDENDALSASKVFIINQAMATALFGKQNPIGQRIAQAGDSSRQWGEIVGVAADVRSVMPDPPLVTFQLYQPMAQEPRAQNEIAVRASGVATGPLIDSIRHVVTTLDVDLPIRRLRTADATIDRANYQLGVLRDMLDWIALLGLGLAGLGIYGVMARTTALRTNEFAIRLALGACLRDITRLVLTSGVKLAVIGSAIGLVGAMGVAQLLSAGFPGMQIKDPLVLLVTVVILVGVALFACWLPARRAANVDAMLALRAE